MFLKHSEEDISDYEFQQIIEPHHNQFDRYFEEYVIPESIAYFLATGYYTSSMYEESFRIHINSVLAEFFNYEVKDVKSLKKRIKRILLVKYSLKVDDEDPLDLIVDKHIS